MSGHPTVIHERVAQARDGDNPTVIARMASGWAVLGDHQFLPGYALLLPDPVVVHVTDLDPGRRARYLLDMTRVGEALLEVTDSYRINYEILGNTAPALHAHVFARYLWEPDEHRAVPVWSYPAETLRTVPFSLEEHGGLRGALADVLAQDG
ncbi:MAG TPA: HIT domain-containing protein [Euzebyales bacterium]|nr:HIT domain-containing protein [Euzebyales bacterium]